VSFEVAADAYDRFMGRYSVPLATHFVEFAHVLPGQRAIDVGCGPGAVTGELVTRLGAEVVAAVDPSEQFVAAVRERHPGVDVRRAFAEDLPFADNEFDVSLAQLVVHFMADPLAGLGEMVRVTRPDGLVVASVWDHAGGRSPISLFWAAAREIDPKVDDWWEPFRLGVGPAGTYAAGLEPEQLAALKERCRKLVPEPFRFEAVAWAARGEV
jgi:ubiquinone/menaquinone biosynthesis C-methylase UbiE